MNQINVDNFEMQENMGKFEERVENLENRETENTEIPSYWEEHLLSKIETIKNLHKTYGKDCFSFIGIFDIHRPSNLGKISPILAKKIMDECSIPYVLIGGDTQTRGCWNTKAELLAEEAEFLKMIEPILDRALLMEGNHDRSYGRFDRDGNGIISNNNSDGSVKPALERETYVNALSQNEYHELRYRKVAMIPNVHFDESGTGYYVHDTANDVRYICLNSHNVPAEYCPMWVFRYGQTQFDFIVNEALVNGVTDRTKIIMSGHVPPFQEIGDREILHGIIKAYINKTSYTDSYAGEYGFDAVTVDVDFTKAKGKFVGFFAGHNHIDSVNKSYGYNIITTRCDAKEENNSSLNEERVAGTITEQSFGVFTITLDTIYETKIGAGEDREISY